MKAVRHLFTLSLALLALGFVGVSQAQADDAVLLDINDAELQVGDIVKATSPVDANGDPITLDLYLGADPQTAVLANTCVATLYAEIVQNPVTPSDPPNSGSLVAEVIGTNFEDCSNFAVTDNIGISGTWGLNVTSNQLGGGGWPLAIEDVDVNIGPFPFTGDLENDVPTGTTFQWYNNNHAEAAVCEQGLVRWPDHTDPADTLPDDLPLIDLDMTGGLLNATLGDGLVDGPLCVFVKDENGEYDTSRNPIRAEDV